MKENVVARIMVLSQEYFSIPSQPITMDLLRHRITLMKLPSSSSASSSTAASLRERADAIAKLDSITWDRLQVQVTDYLAAMLWQEASVGLGKIEICDECEDGAKMEEARRKWDEYDEAVKVYTVSAAIPFSPSFHNNDKNNNNNDNNGHVQSANRFLLFFRPLLV